jgi:hypothetical protein
MRIACLSYIITAPANSCDERNRSCRYNHQFLKRVTKIPAKRNSPDVIELRFGAIEAGINDYNIRLMQNCIFTDGSGFNLYTVRSQGRSKKGEPAKVVVSTTRGSSVSILGTICSLSVVIAGLKVTEAGTKWKEFMAFLIHAMNVLDKHNLKDYNLVWIIHLSIILKGSQRRSIREGIG